MHSRAGPNLRKLAYACLHDNLHTCRDRAFSESEGMYPDQGRCQKAVFTQIMRYLKKLPPNALIQDKSRFCMEKSLSEVGDFRIQAQMEFPKKFHKCRDLNYGRCLRGMQTVSA
jgi:hypothetical protein